MKPALGPPPSPSLARFVRSVRLVPRAEDLQPYGKLPDGEVDLVVRYRASGAEIYAIGTRSVALDKSHERADRAIALRFRAGGAYPFFGVPIAELTDRVVPLASLWGAEGARLADRLADAATTADGLRLLEGALEARLQSHALFEPASVHVVRHAVRALSTATPAPSVNELAKQLTMSPRQLRRLFDEVVGVGPKVFARIARFQRALAAMALPTRVEWGALAATAGYYDQAHFIADFRAFTGTTPEAFLRQRRPALFGADGSPREDRALHR